MKKNVGVKQLFDVSGINEETEGSNGSRGEIIGMRKVHIIV